MIPMRTDGQRQAMSTIRSPLLMLVVCILTMMMIQPCVRAQAYPQRPLRMIVPFPPGSPPDALARVIGQQIMLNVGQPVIADSRPGAGGTLGTDIGAKASPDGYTITIAVLGPIGLAPTLYAQLP